MVSPVEEYYNIVEPFHDGYDVGSYLFDNKIRYNMRVSTKTEFDIDLNWMATTTFAQVVVYTARLSKEDILYLTLKFPGLSICKPKSPEKIADMARRLIL